MVGRSVVPTAKPAEDPHASTVNTLQEVQWLDKDLWPDI